MKLYLSTIGIAMLIISAVNILCGTASWYYVLCATVFCTVLQIALDGTIAFLINKLPNAWFAVHNPLYRVSKRERRLYKRLKVKAWKDKVLELGALGGFSKKVLKEPHNPRYVERFIIECHKGVATHRLSYPIGFLAMLTLPNVCALTIALPVAVVNVYLNVLPTLALRYNTPMLITIFDGLVRREKKNAERSS